MSMSAEYSGEQGRQHAEWKAARARLAAAAYVKPKLEKPVENPVRVVIAEPVIESVDSGPRDWLHVSTSENLILPMGAVFKEICEQFDVSRNELESIRRDQQIVVPRQVAMILAKHLTRRSFPEIGRRLGGRDHTTVLHACRKWEPIMDACIRVVPVGSPVGVWVHQFKEQMKTVKPLPSSKYTRKTFDPAI